MYYCHRLSTQMLLTNLSDLRYSLLKEMYYLTSYSLQ